MQPLLVFHFHFFSKLMLLGHIIPQLVAMEFVSDVSAQPCTCTYDGNNRSKFVLCHEIYFARCDGMV